MHTELLKGIFTPFFGTVLGSACVLFMNNKVNQILHKALTGLACGVMVAASIWSLLLPAMEQSQDMGRRAFIPMAVGFWIGTLFLMLVDRMLFRINQDNGEVQIKNSMQRTMMLVLAVTLHNLPEGMAVGVVYAGWLSGDAGITVMGAWALALGIAIQNFPEGSIISMPLQAEGFSKKKAFFYGVLSGIVEPIGAGLTILAASMVVPVLPYLLSFAAGAMLYVVVEELIPEMMQGKHSYMGTLFFTVGFTMMMSLDVSFG